MDRLASFVSLAKGYYVLDFREGLAEVFDKVLGIFQADGDSDEGIGDPGFSSRGWVVACMRHCSGLFDQGFHGTAADGKAEDFGTFADSFRRIDIAVDIEGYHGTELFTEVLFGALVMGV
jgi:hypothetical protein